MDDSESKIIRELEGQFNRIEVKVEELGKDFHGLRNDLFANRTPGHAAMEQKVADIDKRLERVDSNLIKVSDEIKASSKFPIGPTMTFAGLLISVLGLGGTVVGSYVINPIKSDVERLDKEFGSLKTTYVPRAEIDERRRALSQTDEDFNRRLTILESSIRRPPR